MSSTASTTPTAPTAASASASVKTPVKGSTSDIFKGILYYTPMIVGILIIIISYGVHFATITYGTSGSDFVGTNLNSTVWPLVIGLLFFFVGFIVWIWSGLNSEYRFFGLFLLCLACLLSSNAALYFSLIQVTVTPK
jgi:hypothetical protein